MTDGEVADLFRLYADEPDQTFLDAATVTTFCTIGLEKYRGLVAEINPMGLMTGQHFTLPMGAPADNNQINLMAATDEGNAIYGAPAVGLGRHIKSIHSLYIKQAASVTPSAIFQPVYSYGEMAHSSAPSYFWRGPNIFLSYNVNDTVAIEYIPIQDTLTFAVGATAFIDNFGPFHDLIALYACRHYAVMDGAPNPMAEALIPSRERDLQRYFVSRVGLGPQYVADLTSTEAY